MGSLPPKSANPPPSSRLEYYKCAPGGFETFRTSKKRTVTPVPQREIQTPQSRDAFINMVDHIRGLSEQEKPSQQTTPRFGSFIQDRTPTIPTKIEIDLPSQLWPSDLVKVMNKWHKFLGGTSIFCGLLFITKILTVKLAAVIFPFLLVAAFLGFMFCPSSIIKYVYDKIDFFIPFSDDHGFAKGNKIRSEVQSVLTLTQTDRADLDTQRDLISIDDEILIDPKWITKASTGTRLYLNKAEALAVEDIIAKSREQHRIKQSRIAQEVIGDSANQMIESTLNDTLAKLNQSQTAIHESSPFAPCASEPTISPETPIVQSVQPPPQNTLYT